MSYEERMRKRFEEVEKEVKECTIENCICSEIFKSFKEREEHRRWHESQPEEHQSEWGCSTCNGGSEKQQIKDYHTFRKMGIPVELHSPGTFIIGKKYRQFYYWPKSAKWRPKGKTKVYRSKGANHVIEILNR